MTEVSNPMLIRYTEHPAYCNLGAREEELEGLDAFKNIDLALRDVFEGRERLEPSQIEEFFGDQVSAHVKVLVRTIESRMKEGDLFRPVALGSLNKLEEALRSETLYRTKGGKFAVSPNQAAGVRKNAESLRDRGFFTTRLDQELLTRFWEGIAPWRAQLEGRRRAAPQNMASCVVPLPQEGPVWRTFTRALRGGEIQESINAFSPYSLDLDYCALQLSHPHEQWWKNCYEDLGIPTSKTSYLHFDQDYALIKAIVYLQPVTKDNGPFALIPGSSRLPLAYAREAFFKQLDASMYELFKDRPAATPYYRKQFKDLDFRREFVKIPSAFRGTSHFGDDILDGSPQSEWMLKHEVPVTSDIGNCTVFTGGRTLHRGGMVEQGERWVLQLGFRERDPTWQGLTRRLKKQVKASVPTPILGMVRSLKRR